jgi:hypothetical protein
MLTRVGVQGSGAVALKAQSSSREHSLARDELDAKKRNRSPRQQTIVLGHCTEGPERPALTREVLLEQPGLHGRHRDKNGELSKKHGNTLVRTLRKVYGQHFAEGCAPEEKLSDVLHKLDEPSLSKLVHDHERGKLGEKIASGV